jgi:ATP-binding cassette, subfamily B, bacterial PglK
LGVIPFLVASALVEVIGVAAVLPFLSLLASPEAFTLPTWLADWRVMSAMDDRVTLLRWAGVTLALLLVLANGLLLATNYWLLHFAWGLNHAMSARLLRRYLTQPYTFMLMRNTAALANRVVVEVRQVVEYGIQAGLEVLTRSVVLLALVAVLVALDPLTAVVAFISMGTLYGAIFLVTRRYLRRIGTESVERSAARLKAVNEALGGFKDLRVIGREASAYRRYLVPSRRHSEIHAARTAISGLPRFALEALAVGGLVLIASLMAGREGGVAGALPLLGAYAFAGMRMLPAIQTVFGAAARLRFASGSLDTLEADFVDLRDEERLDPEEPVAMRFAHAIELRSVTFSYPSWEEPALADVCLSIEKHRSIAIVGRTGSGKTTLVDVLLGLLEPQQGSLWVDGVRVDRTQLRAYRRLFGYVPQSIFLLDDTVAHNVALGLEDDQIDFDAVRRACREAQIAEFIESELPLGYRTPVGERGVRLSGGQRQRIGIARALYHQPEVLVFDEATSALDVHTEQQVFQALEGIAKERTVVTAADRREVDHVIVLEPLRRGRTRGGPASGRRGSRGMRLHATGTRRSRAAGPRWWRAAARSPAASAWGSCPSAAACAAASRRGRRRTPPGPGRRRGRSAGSRGRRCPRSACRPAASTRAARPPPQHLDRLLQVAPDIRATSSRSVWYSG